RRPPLSILFPYTTLFRSIYKITTRLITQSRKASGATANITGILAAAGWCFFSPTQAYSVILMPTVGATFVFWLLVWQIVRTDSRSEEHTSELQSPYDLVC